MLGHAAPLSLSPSLAVGCPRKPYYRLDSRASAVAIGGDQGWANDLAGLLAHGRVTCGVIPSTPLDAKIRKVLPDLPLRSGLPSDKLCPQCIRKALIEAGEALNQVVHRGAMPRIHLRSTLMDIREVLYLLDWHAGHTWAESLLSHDTREAIRWS